MFSNILDNVKAFFKRSWSIFIARAELFTGFIIGVVGSIDWAGFANIDFGAGFSRNQTMWIAIGLVIKGIVSEIGRRAGTVETVTSQLVPVNIAEKADVKLKQ